MWIRPAFFSMLRFVSPFLAGYSIFGAKDYELGKWAHSWGDEKSARALWLIAAERWHRPAQDALAALCPVGHGVEPHSDLWWDWCRDAVAMDDAAAYRNLAAAILAGAGAKPDPESGLQILGDLADKSDLVAIAMLAAAHAEGRPSVPKDMSKARDWSLAGARLGDAGSAYRLCLIHAHAGRDYAKDNAVAKDLGAAATWAIVARGLGYRGPGHEVIDKRIHTFLAALSEREAAEAEQRAEDWLAAHPDR